MSRKKYKMSTREKVLLVLTVLVIATAATVIFAYMPMMERLEELEGDLRRAQDVQHDMRMLDIRLEYLINEVSTFDEVVEENLAKYENLGNNEDLDHQFTLFLTETDVKVLDLRILDEEPLSEEGTGYLSRQSVNIRVDGGLHDQIKFLDYVKDFWSFRVRSYNFDNDPELPSGNYILELFFSDVWEE
jgi:Tfp pilus assembly protein PilO